VAEAARAAGSLQAEVGRSSWQGGLKNPVLDDGLGPARAELAPQNVLKAQTGRGRL
jgi:hypothetical protein